MKYAQWISAWLITRLTMLVLWFGGEHHIVNDVTYYWHQLTSHPLREALIEYPTFVAVLLDMMRWISLGDAQSFTALFMVTMALIDLGMSVYLWSQGYRRAAVYWSALLFALGPLTWTRLDLLPAAAVTCALIVMTTHPWRSGIWVSLGAATKLWPAMVIAPLWGRGQHSWPRTLGFLLSGGALGLWSLAFFGWERSASPLTWQRGRGLQIESVWATPAMIDFARGGETEVEFTSFNAFEVFGPGVQTASHLADVTMMSMLVVVVLYAWLIGLGGVGLPGHRRPTHEGAISVTYPIVMAVISLTSLVIVTNKTFSPQYLMWLAGPLAIAMSLPLAPRLRRRAMILGALGLVITALTHLVYPTWYGGVISHGPLTALAVSTLVVRNIVMVALALASTIEAIRASLLVGREAPQELDTPVSEA